jgi:Tol biopolymer transport system component
MGALRIPIGLFVALLALTSCDGTTEPPPEEHPRASVLVLEAVTPLSATGVVGEELAVAPIVLVQGDGLPVEDVWVSFAVSGRGSVGSATARTDAAGLATPGTWRLGPGAGPQTLTVRAVGLLLKFTADAQPGPITSFAVVGGNGQWAAAGTPLPAPLRVKAADRYGNVVTDVAVTFAVVDGGGSLEPGASMTGADGVAESRWTLGTTGGRQQVRAQTSDAIAQFAADACPGPCSSELAHVLNGNIVIFNSATGATRQLTNDGVSGGPAWSPDGERIAFARSGAENGIYVMNSDGTGATRVTGPGYHSPTWSPQGDALAFAGSSSSTCPGDQYCGAIYVQELREGSVMRQVAASGSGPAWSPDGSRIAFRHIILINDEDNDDDDLNQAISSLRLVNIDGSGLTEITPLTSVTSGPTWSPDGTRIAFSTVWDIYVIRAEGTGQTRLATYNWSYEAPLTAGWSPDGTRIAYGTRGNNIMQVPAEGGEPTLMTRGGSPSWRP